MKKLARGRALTADQQAFREEFETAREYLDSQQLYEETFKYMQYKVERGENV
jgi:hypothetical protein